MNFLEFVFDKAAQCGWQVSEVLTDSMVKLTFETSMGDEYVYIRPYGKNTDGNTVIEFTSLGIPVPDDPIDAGSIGLYLLQRNGEMLLGNWGIEILNEQRHFTVFAKLIANTMDIDEFKGAVTAIVGERIRVAKSAQKNAIDF
ncbi:hypothetical protein [Pantanalinema sp. GBBB05]|uniref:hypothetical protein n=1 Tax=Pantanalinema sp. GBBB05 TaxID=2604139 RepID=UPI001DA204AD|nr:hypothetical protein [Pantanalinema sp. GBBB05]